LFNQKLCSAANEKFRYRIVSLGFFGFQPHQLAQRHALPYQGKKTGTQIETILFISCSVLSSQNQ
ncbi:hypothetical protein, partial [Leeuwenhoekiella marinoflava]|uniref:hypothetical protein n=1 Tax=Leeuwenhoekiella marinoflava TaxID=988 RepID=UPI00300211A0